MDPYNVFQRKQIKFNDILKKQQQPLQRSKIRFIQPPKKSMKQGINLSQYSQHFLLPSFVMLIIGGMSSGKSHFISQMISNPKLLGYRFDRIIYMGTSSYPGCIFQQQNFNAKFDLQWLNRQIKRCNQWKCQNMLVIIDDLVSQLKGQSQNQLQRLIYNRRHVMTQNQKIKGNISFMITTQKLTSLPRMIRDVSNLITCFRINGQQTNTIVKQCPILKTNIMAKSVLQRLQQNKFIFININKGKVFYDQYFQQI